MGGNLRDSLHERKVDVGQIEASQVLLQDRLVFSTAVPTVAFQRGLAEPNT